MMFRLTKLNICMVMQNTVKHCKYSISATGSESDVYRRKLTESDVELKTSEKQDQKMPFARSKIGPFFQQQPTLSNQFLEDVTLQNYLKRFLPDEAYQDISQDLTRFGARVGGELYRLGRECETNPPQLKQFNAWGERVDEISTCSAWNYMKTVSAEEGLIAIAYERKYKEFSRLYQMAKLYLFGPSSGLYSCPLAMTDGAAKTAEVLNYPPPLAAAYKHLISRHPDKFWTSGQWMTERKGGSDVGNSTETLAVAQPDGLYRLYGYKWFTSATDADMTLTLARIVDNNGQPQAGSRGLSMFYLKVHDDQNKLNNMEMQRLKDKLGTRQLPTAELLLDGTIATKISDEGRGVAAISSMLQISRLHNALMAVGAMRRIINLARDYSHKRQCFGKTIKDFPLHIKTLASMEMEARAGLLLSLDMARLLGVSECTDSDADHQMDVYRLLSPVAKLFTAKQAVAVASEGLECFGGAGYLEDTGLPSILRDAQVLPIWEGTTSVLCMDVLRALGKSKSHCLGAFHLEVTSRLEPISTTELQSSKHKLMQSAQEIVKYATQHTGKLEASGRDFAFSLARVYIGMLFVEHASWTGCSQADIMVANRWCEQDLLPMTTNNTAEHYEASTLQTEAQLVFSGYSQSRM